MIQFIESIENFFTLKNKNLDGKFWVQKIILQKYLKKN